MNIVSIMYRPIDSSTRLTPQRLTVLNALNGSAPGRTAAELFRCLRQDGNAIGLSTVYRALDALIRAGLVDVSPDDTGKQVFRVRLNGRPDHFLTCHSCGHGVLVNAEPVARWAAETAARHGFAAVEPLIRLSGRCPHCANESEHPSPPPPIAHGDPLI